MERCVPLARNVMHTSCVMTASPCVVPFGRVKEHITATKVYAYDFFQQDKGEVIEGKCGAYYYETELTFNFRNTHYVFSSSSKDEYLGTLSGAIANAEYIIDTEEHLRTTGDNTRTLVCEFGMITIYDTTHFRYQEQNYLITSDETFAFAFENSAP